VVAPELIGCLLVKRQADGSLTWGVIVETEAYSQGELACHGYRRRTPSNETLFGEPGWFYVYMSYGIHHCVTVLISTLAGIETSVPSMILEANLHATDPRYPQIAPSHNKEGL